MTSGSRPRAATFGPSPYVFVLAAVLLAGCSRMPRIALEDLSIALGVPEARVLFGKSFELTVTRSWRKDWMPEPWGDESLAPLVVRLLDVTTREDALRIEEIRRFEAFAFLRERVSVAPGLRARTPLGDLRASRPKEPLVLEVVPALDPSSPGEVELPDAPLDPSFSWRRYGGLLAAVLGAVAILLRVSSLPPAPRKQEIRGRVAAPPDSTELMEDFTPPGGQGRCPSRGTRAVHAPRS